MRLFSIQRFLGRTLVLLAIALHGSLLLSPSFAQESANPLQKEVDAIAARIQELRDAGEEKLAEQHEKGLRQTLRNLENSIGQSLVETLEARKPPIEKHLEIARREIARLKKEGDAKTAGELEKLLLPFQQAGKTGEYDFEENDDPQLHLVTVRYGSTLPKEYGDGKDRRSHGFAEVNVNVTSRPVVLALQSHHPVKWKVNVADGVRIHAVVLTRPDNEIINADGLFQLTSMGGGVPNALEDFTGLPLASKIDLHNYRGKPVEIGPENPVWLGSYLGPKVEEISGRARLARQQIGIARLKELRFPAMYFAGEPGSGRGPGFSAVSRGTFSIQGPIADTMRPVLFDRLRQLIVVEGEEKQSFVLTSHGEFAVELGEGIQKNGPRAVPPPAGITPRGRFLSMALDPSRKRILLSMDSGMGSTCVFYDVGESEWAEDWSVGHKLCGLTYVEDFDGYYGILEAGFRNPKEAHQLVKLGSDGKIKSRTKIAIDRKLRFGSETQLVAVDDRVVLIMPRTFRDMSTGRQVSLNEQLYLINAISGEVEYSGSIAAHDGNGQLVAAPQIRRVEGTGALAKIDKLVSRAVRDIKALHTVDAPLAAKLNTELDAIRGAMRGEPVKHKEPRLHVVGSYNPFPGTIRVTDRSGPIVLAVSSYESSNWKIEADEGVEIRQIIVGGYEKQEVKSSPDGVPVKDHTRRFYTYGEACDSHPKAVEVLKQLTSLDIATITTNYSENGRTTIVGPENGDFRAQEVISALEKLVTKANVDQSTKALAELRKHRFYAVHYGEMPGVQNKPPVARGPGGVECYHNAFTIDGPLIGRGHLLPARPHTMTFDATKSLIYYATQHDAPISLDPKTGAQEKLELDADLPRLSWQSGLTIDSKRERLLMTSFGGGGFLYGYDIKKKKWSVLRKPGLSTHGIVYAADKDAVYALGVDMGSGRCGELRKHNAHGALLERIPLSKPIQGGRGPGGGVQLSYFPDHLVMIQSPNDHRMRIPPRPGVPGPALPKSTIRVINVRSGEIVHEGELTPHVERVELSELQLKQLWQKLLSAEGTERDELMWDISAGGEAAVRFLESKLKELAPAKPEIDAEVVALAKQLSANKFQARKEATEALEKKGSQILSQLEDLLEEEESAEARSRLKRLIETWKSGEPQTEAEIESSLAIDVLARLGSVEAKRVLENLATSSVGVVKHRAKNVLSDEQ